MKKVITNKLNLYLVEKEYLKDKSTIKSVAKLFHVNNRFITQILKTSSNMNVRNKQDRKHQHRKFIKCKIENCQSRAYSTGLCKIHYDELKEFGHILSDNEKETYKNCCICGSDNKVRKYNGKRYCQKHYYQLYKYGKIFDRTKFDGNDYNIMDDYIEIIMYNSNNAAIVSKNKFDLVKQYTWHIRQDGYVEAKDIKTGKDILLHRLIMGFPDDYQIDHINRNKLDNRNENLRLVHNSQNQVNKNKMKNNTSGITGVTWDKSRNKWKVSLNINSKCYNIGRFDSFDVAKQARFNAEKKYQKQYVPIERQSSSKEDKARKDGVSILTEDEFLKMIKN